MMYWNIYEGLVNGQVCVKPFVIMSVTMLCRLVCNVAEYE